MLSKIFDVLLRFRFNNVAILADIKQVFLSVEVSAEYRDFLRFLWIDMNCEGEKPCYISIFEACLCSYK